MSSRWTMKELRETDALTFAMCILSERREELSQNAPLAKRLKEVYHILGALRDTCRESEPYSQGLISEQEAIFRVVQRNYLIRDIEDHMCGDSYRSKDLLEEHGLTPEGVMEDREMLDRIVRYFEKYDGEDDFWTTLDRAVIDGVTDTLELRKRESSGQ